MRLNEDPESDGQPMSENARHAAIVSLRNALELHNRGREDLLVAGGLLLYWEAGNRKKSIGPNILVALGAPAGHRSSYLVWREGKVPDFVMEASWPGSREGDRTLKRERYESLGVGEYFLYDPGYDGSPSEMRAYRLWGGRYVEERWDGKEDIESAVLGLGFRGDGTKCGCATCARARTCRRCWNWRRAWKRRPGHARPPRSGSRNSKGSCEPPVRRGCQMMGPTGRQGVRRLAWPLRLTFESISAGN